ncbi:unnamed protein product [Linum trigynum]|uniref:Uncharacterized protein n=1 Tax=Linum trigynum TaxID=586398 RepID=A0AAV2FEW8_9ROSI
MKITIVAVSLLAVVLAAATQIRGERPDHRCGPCFDCARCDKGRCCSDASYCGNTSDYCIGIYSRPGYPCLPREKCTGVYDNINGYRWDLKAASLSCSSHTANISHHGMELKGVETPFCLKQGESNTNNRVRASCGQCLKVTSRKTGTQTTVRLPTGNQCNNKDLNLGKRVFEELHSNGEGSDQKGHLTVDYQVVHCAED